MWRAGWRLLGHDRVPWTGAGVSDNREEGNNGGKKEGDLERHAAMRGRRAIATGVRLQRGKDKAAKSTAVRHGLQQRAETCARQIKARIAATEIVCTIPEAT